MNKEKKSLELTFARNVFYKTNSRRLIFVNLGLLILVIALIAYYQYQSKTHIYHKYFPTTPDGVFINMPSLKINHLKFKYLSYDNQGYFKNSPNLNEEVLKKELNVENLDPEFALIQYWAKKAVERFYNLDFVKYRDNLQKTRDYFTIAGHKNFLSYLDESNNLQSVKTFKHIVSAKVDGLPYIEKQYIYSGRYACDVVVPFELTFDNGDDVKIEEKWEARLLIVRADTLKSPFFGLVVHKSIFVPRK